MIRRNLTYMAIMGACFGAPYSYYNVDFKEATSSAWEMAEGVIPSGDEKKNETPDSLIGVPAFVSNTQTGGTSPGSSTPTISIAGAGTPTDPAFHSLQEALNFEATPRWIMARWPRVSTTLADLNLEGLRVPLVTGTEVNDLAGSLTYYFDRNQRVQRITFRGQTGDDRKIIQMLTSKPFEFQREPSLGAGLYMTRWNGKPTSIFRVTNAPVIYASSPHSRHQVELEINRPSKYYSLSPDMQAIVTQDKRSFRWGKR
ncbi:MAG: hypothetical protein COA78_02410 [Blastopirellula sp.]|nr:MAG: hypothetical protein COA78_02410 [Blastopirellula sp.]